MTKTVELIIYVLDIRILVIEYYLELNAWCLEFIKLSKYMPESPLKIQDYTSSYKLTWCPGCGNYAIFTATRNALIALGLRPYEVVVVFGIGCSSNGANFYKLYSYHGIHGRTLPAACGIKLSNHKLTVIADAGDGDSFGEGAGHFIHTPRGNVDITYFTHDNRMFSLTKGQISPTAERGMKTETTPDGSIEVPLNPLALAITNGATFVAQGFCGDIPHLTEILIKAIKHRGFSFVNILQVCITFNKINTLDWYKERVYKLEDTDHDTASYGKALAVTLKPQEKIPTGVIYQVEKPIYEENLLQIKDIPLVQQKIDNIDIRDGLEKYK